MDLSHVTWRKASYSGGNGGGCVEVASADKTLVAIRDSKDPHGPKLAFTPPIWQSFIQQVRNPLPGTGYAIPVLNPSTPHWPHS